MGAISNNRCQVSMFALVALARRGSPLSYALALRRREGHTVTLAFERLDGAAARAFGVARVLAVGTRVLVGRLTSQDAAGTSSPGASPVHGAHRTR